MRSLFYPVLVLILAVVAGLVWLVIRPPWMAQVSTTIAAIVGGDSKPASEPKPSPIVEAKKDVKKKPGAREPVMMASRVEMTPLQPIETAAALPRRFPLANGVTAGTARAAVLANFGLPDASAIGSDIGQLRERYIYVDLATGRKTFISLINGNVTGAETVTQ